MSEHDEMLGVLYERAFQTKKEAELHCGEDTDRNYAIALAKNELLNELIGIRTAQIKRS